MSWNMYTWTFQLKSPLHIGFHKVMHFFRTRHYIPGKLLWGALTAKLTPILGMSDYEQVGDWLKESFRFGYLFPSVEEEIYIPKYTDEGYKFGNLSQYEFEKRFISSTASVAVESCSLSAEEGMLHEVEFISPHTIDNGKPVYLKGFLWVKDSQDNQFKIIKKNGKLYIQYSGVEVDFKAELADNFQVGGERKYGFGLLKLIKIHNRNLNPFSGKWGEENSEVNLTFNSNEATWSHLRYSEHLDMKGNIEPLVGRNWEIRKGAGRKLESLGLFWSPGSILRQEKTVKVNEFGLWELKG